MFTIVTIQRLPEPATRAEADRLAAFTVAGEPVDEITASVVEGEPLILAGLVKGGEIRDLSDWKACASPALLVDATGRLVPSIGAFSAVRARGALPITWYRVA